MTTRARTALLALGTALYALMLVVILLCAAEASAQTIIPGPVGDCAAIDPAGKKLCYGGTVEYLAPDTMWLNDEVQPYPTSGAFDPLMTCHTIVGSEEFSTPDLKPLDKVVVVVGCPERPVYVWCTNRESSDGGSPICGDALFRAIGIPGPPLLAK